MTRRIAFFAASAAAAAGICFGQTVSVSLTSPQDGQNVSPGATIDWSISFTVSSGDNAGLALISVDLVQDGGNAELFDIPPADSVPGAMTNFSRPAGICNPGEGGSPTGYIGVLRGPVGGRNLIQIGGGQNSFGQAFSPGVGVAENANVVAGVGQSGSVLMASGSFTAPSTDGSYEFSIQNALANVFSTINSPPNHSPVIAAGVAVPSPTFSFTVGGAAPCPGDCDGSGDVGLSDLVAILSNFADPTVGNCDGGLTGLVDVLSNFGTVCP